MLYFEFETVLKFYNLEARFSGIVVQNEFSAAFKVGSFIQKLCSGVSYQIHCRAHAFLFSYID